MNFRDLVCAGVGAETPKAVLPLPDLLTRLPSAREEYLFPAVTPRPERQRLWRALRSSMEGDRLHLHSYPEGFPASCSTPLLSEPRRAPDKFRGDELVLSTLLGSLSHRVFSITPEL